MAVEINPQNSLFRETTNGPLLALVRWLHHQPYLEKITPNGITYFGAATQPFGSAASVCILSEDELSVGDRVKSGLSTLGPQIPDALDGKMATVFKEEEPEKVDPDGDLKDFTADRWAEFCTVVQRMIVAYKRGSKLGVAMAFLSGVTNPLTSHFRAEAEVRGKVVPEVKFGLESAGNRFGRAITSTASASFPEAQPLIDAVSAGSNIKSALSRRRAAFNKVGINYEELDEEQIAKLEHMKERAGKRLRISRWAIAGTVIGLSATMIGLRMLDYKNQPE